MEPPPRYHLEVDPLFSELLPNDLKRLERVRLQATRTARTHLLRQSVVGHAQKGHGAFAYQAKHGKTRDGAAIYPNTDTWEVLHALSRMMKNPEQYLERKLRERENIVDLIRKWLIRAATGEPLERLVLEEKPLGGITLFEKRKITNPADVVRGYLFGVSMDNFEKRRKVKETYNLEMGGGEHHIINFAALRESGLTLEKLAAIPFESNVPQKQLSIDLWELKEGDGIEWLQQEGIIVSNPQKRDFFTPEERPAYVRLVHGLGVSDDAAVVIGTFLYGLDFGYGVVLADAVDTWDKALLKWQAYGKGADEQIATDLRGRLQQREKGLLPNSEDVTQFIYLAAIDPARQTQYPDCSQRRFLQQIKNRTRAVCPLQPHLSFGTALRECVNKEGYFDGKEAMNILNRSSFPDIKISFSEVPIRKFYTELIRRLTTFQRNYVPLGEIMR